MSLNAKTWIYRSLVVFATLGSLSATLFLAALADRRVLTFESLESKTNALKPVFNRIMFSQGTSGDIWLMQQSHQGLPTSDHEWSTADLIAISITDSATGQQRATFLQLTPAPLEAHQDQVDLSKAEGFKAPCAMCHSNGPRVIRPNLKSADTPLSYWDRWRVFAWNLKIKSYGKVSVAPSPSESLGPVPFRFSSTAANKPLTVEACAICHKETGFLARGVLTKQNQPSIRFMVENGFMPPLGMQLPESDRRELMRFLAL